MTVLNRAKRDLSVCEVMEKDGMSTRTERRCVYFIKRKIHLDGQFDVSKLDEMKDSGGLWKRRHFHIMRTRKSELGEDGLFCKVAGNLYAIVGQDVYCIAFVHSFKIGLVSIPSTKK